MTQTLPPDCKVTKWFIWRAILMLFMFGGFGFYFLYDWKIGYPKKNYVVAHYKAFSDAGSAWADNRENWEEYVAKQTIPFDEDHSLYPKDTDFGASWPEILSDRDGMEGGNDEGLWKKFSGERGWKQNVDLQEDFMSKYKIDQQLYAAIVCFILTAIALYFYLRTRGRAMKVDSDAYYSPEGHRIPFNTMTQIDKRKWETKGLATITYTDEKGEEAKAKVDGMVYGQFKEEEGAPAEALFQYVLENFEGELVELVIEEDEDEESDTEEDLDDEGSGENEGDSTADEVSEDDIEKE
ncbi:hypothetical protein N9Z02_02245 [Akkermansiaceae bacterium]|nr:hypothetical protein [Akkermansiaceae bacterium]